MISFVMFDGVVSFVSLKRSRLGSARSCDRSGVYPSFISF